MSDTNEMHIHGEKQPERGSFAEKIIALDCALTGVPWYRAIHTFRDNSIKTPIDWMLANDSYYLSDGGYSRLVLGNGGHIWLTSNSTDRAKAAWPSCQKQIADVEETLRKELE